MIQNADGGNDEWRERGMTDLHLSPEWWCDVWAMIGTGKTGGGMPDVKKPDPNICSCGHPFGKKEAAARHEKQEQERITLARNDRITNIEQRLINIGHETNAHKHWWQ